MPVADRGHRLHLLVGRVAAEIGRDDRRVAQHLGHEAVRTAAEGRGEDRAAFIDHEDIRLALVGAELVHFLLESRDVRGEQVIGQAKAADARVVAVKPAFEIASHRGQTATLVHAHADRVQLQRGHAVVVHQFPQFRQVLHQRRDDLARGADVAERIGHHEGFQPGQRIEGHGGHIALVQFLDINAAAMGQGHCGRAIPGVVGDREIDLMFGRHAGLEGDAIGLGIGIAVAMFREIEPFLFGQGGLQIGGLANQPGLALLANTAAKQGLDEDQPVAVDQALDIVFAGIGAEDFGCRKPDMVQ